MDPNTSLAHLETSEWTGVSRDHGGVSWDGWYWLLAPSGRSGVASDQHGQFNGCFGGFPVISRRFQTVQVDPPALPVHLETSESMEILVADVRATAEPTGAPSVALRGVRRRYSDFWCFQTVSDSLQTVFRQFLSSSAKIRTSGSAVFSYVKAIPLS